jgi:ubiquitin-conjugating enzyme E2 S
MREISELKKSPPEGIRIATNDDNMLDVTGIIEGPGEFSFLHRHQWTNASR